MEVIRQRVMNAIIENGKNIMGNNWDNNYKKDMGEKMTDLKLEKESYLSNILQREVDRLSNIMYDKDDCKPIFKVSINCDNNRDFAPDLYLICEHCGMTVNRKINLFPKTECGFYTEFSLAEFMTYLYNCTM